MTTSIRETVGELVRWTARLWSLPVIAVTFLLAAGPFVPGISKIGGNAFMFHMSSLYSMVFAVAFVVAWRWESVGGWIALVSAVAFKVWFTIRSGHLPMSPFDLLVWPPAILFLLSSVVHGSRTQESESDRQVPQKGTRRFLALPRTNLGWWSVLIATGFFVFMRLFWMQALRPGRDRGTFFSDPVNACCLIGAFGSPIIGAIVALVAIIWKGERSLLIVPVILLGLFALPWVLAALFGGNP